MTELTPAAQLRWLMDALTKNKILQQKVIYLSGYKEDVMGIPQPVYEEKWVNIPTVLAE